MNRRYHLRRVDTKATLAMNVSILGLLSTAKHMGCAWFVWDMRDGKRVSL